MILKITWKINGKSMEYLELLKKRRSVKKYLPKMVDDESINKIVEAGLYSPSGKNKQAVKFLVVTNKEMVSKLSKLNASILGVDIDPFYGAPVVIVVLADKNVSTYIEDGSIALSNMMNEAYSIGVDSCWIHRAKEMFETKEGREILKSVGIEESYQGIGNCVLGYRAIEFKTKERLPNRIYFFK